MPDAEKSFSADVAAEMMASNAVMGAEPSAAARPSQGKRSDAKIDAPARSEERVKKDRQPKIRGFLDTVQNGCAEGWAVDDTAPAKVQTIEIWDDSKLVAVGKADKFRPDLKAAGLGDGHAAFSVALPSHLYDGQEHTILAKVAATEIVLEKPLTVFLPRQGVSGGIEGVEGTALKGWLESSSDLPTEVDLLADNQVIRKFEVAPRQGREEFRLQLPHEMLDGRVHWFQLRGHDSTAVIAEAVAATTFVSTPEQALQLYAKSFPGGLSASSQRRYASLERQFALARHVLAEQSKATSPMTLEQYWDQLVLVHEQVKRGIGEQNRKPDVLRFVRHDKPKVSVVIPVHNKFWVTYNCLASLILAPNMASMEIIVVDDGSSDLTMSLSEYAQGITVLRNEVAQGFVKTSNKGGQAARGEFVVMLNNDTEVCAGWLDELLYVFENFEGVGLVGSKLVYPDGKLQEAGGIIFPNFDAWNYGRGKNAYDPRFNYVRQVDYASGAAIMLRKDVWDKLKGFDELYAPAYYEDTDLAFRVRALGLKTYYTPFSEVIHFEGVSSGTSVTSGVKRYQAINEPKFRSRWASTIRSFPGQLDPDLAKDRGVLLRALVIDAQTPQPDKDAGSYAAIQEMTLLQKLGVKLVFVPQNLAYLGNYTEGLQRRGIECLYAPFQTSIEDIIRRRGSEFDFFYITRYSVANSYINAIREAAPQAKIVFCNADLHFLREIRAAIAAKNPEALQTALLTRDVELEVMRRTDVTLSYTDTEAAVIASHNLDSTRVMKCPWVVEVDEKAPKYGERSGVAFLGNYQHPPNEEAVVYFVNEVMPELRRTVPGITLHIYGSNLPARMKALGTDDVLIEGYVEDVAEVYHKCRVFIAPLKSGAGIKGKVIGALASGTPTVLSPLAAEGVGISRGSEALIAETTGDWVRSIESLYQDEKRWTEMSRRAIAFTKENFSFELGLERMRSALAAAGIYVG